jgi:hypothetical protein
LKSILRRLAVLGLLGLAVVCAATPARAGFVPVFLGTTPNGPLTNYNYTLNFTTNSTTSETLATGDFVTLYDIGAATFVAPAGLTVTQSLTGVTAVGTAPTDLSNVLNVTFTYTGPTLTVDTTFAGVVITSSFAPRPGQYTSTDTIPLGKNGQIGPVTLPNGVPEPGSIALLGLGGLGALTLLRRRARAGI